MPKSPERTALHDLYCTSQPEGLPPYLVNLYPHYLPMALYLGTAGSCPNGGPGIRYAPWDWEADWPITLVRVVEWGAPQTPIPTALYRLRDQAGDLHYVGITDTPERRWKDHAKDKTWWPEVAERTVEWFPSRAHAMAAEAIAIRGERPRHNIQHNGARKPQ
jgi:predicted GIY-YIG superfamily endonuclease